MDISKLTIEGFKSFYEKSVFVFGKNITAIVGPNGSGKSNITESIRFVLGEQSSKSMRGKDVTDMLYKGNTKNANKAKVEIVFSRNQNFKLMSGNSENIFVKNALEKEEVSITRTVYLDGKSIYEMNGVEVRLKDITEFLLYVHLGNKSSWHISQGEADKILQASKEERRTIIEDALGLKVYHSRINESARKLEKTKLNINEASLKRRELAPELKELEKQVERIRRSHEFRSELEAKARSFLKFKRNKLSKLESEDTAKLSLSDLESRLGSVTKEIIEKERNLHSEGGLDSNLLEDRLNKEGVVLKHLETEYSDKITQVTNFKNKLDYFKVEEENLKSEIVKMDKELSDISSSGNDLIFNEVNVTNTSRYIDEKINGSLDKNREDLIIDIKDIDLEFKKMVSKGSVVTKDNVKQVSYLQSVKTRLQDKLQDTARKINSLLEEESLQKPAMDSLQVKLEIVRKTIESLKNEIINFKLSKVEEERDLQKFILEKSELNSKIFERKNLQNRIDTLDLEINSDLDDFRFILGNSFYEDENVQEIVSDEEYHQIQRSIERLKIRLEESVVRDPDEIENKFKELSERDVFLLKEIGDLEQGMANLENLIKDLKESLKSEFENGLKHINEVFDSYVKKLFGGGSGSIYVTKIEQKTKGDDEEVKDEEDKIGIEVDVNIPKKKLKGLHSMSGGERALISIALNFSIINQNPAPFMILDETDAALDEANSKRYGEILEMLKSQTKLIVVTHNRETMHFADQIYGVTLHKDGYSKVLSVSFDDAVEFAK